MSERRMVERVQKVRWTDGGICNQDKLGLDES